jgi:pimeloyl-ACP methyl ester carboxylesterase
MADKVIRFNKSLLHFKVVGTGSRNLFIFHGFGQDHQAFQTVSDSLSSDYTLYVFDLYFHGKSEWGHDELPLEKDQWRSTVEMLLKEYHIERFSLAGYSLGGKFVLATAEAFPDKTEAIFLLAPDGIKTSFWYSLATYPILFRKLFKSMISHPARFTMIVNILKNAGLLDKGLVRFVELQMNTAEKRKRVYYSWVVFRRLEFDLKRIANIINHNSIPITLVIGKYDKVIKPENMQRLLRHLKNYRLEIVETGHNSLIRESIPFLK